MLMANKKTRSANNKNIVQAQFSSLLTIDEITLEDLNQHYTIHLDSNTSLAEIITLLNDNISSTEHVKYCLNKALLPEEYLNLHGTDWVYLNESTDNYFKIIL